MKNNIDNIFKDKFSQFEAPVSDGLWNKIQENPQWKNHLRRQKIRNLSIYAVLTAIVISTCVILLLHTNKAANEDFDTSLTAEQTTCEVSQTTDENMVTNSDMPEGNIQNNTTENDPATTVPEANTPHDNSSPAIPNEEANPNPIPNKAESTENQDNAINPTAPNSSVETPSIDKATKPQPNVAPKTGNKGDDNLTPETSSTPNNSSNENQNTVLFSIPNAFTPNGDGLNDVFRPVTSASILQYQMDIFSMSGQHLFSSKSIEYGWNGEYQGGMMDNGSYVYVIKYKDNNGKEHIDKGQLLLIR